MRIAEKIAQLYLPAGSYVVFGSCVLEMSGIRTARDIDIVVTPELFEEFKAKGDWRVVQHDGFETLEKDGFDLTISWDHPENLPNVEELVVDAEIVEGIPFVCLDRLASWKRQAGRDKDILDLELIQTYQKGSHTCIM
jgi:hypothetical protein